MVSLLNNNVRRREKDSQSSDDGEHSKDKETDAIYNHGGELPIGDQIVFVFLLLQFGCDEAQFTYNRLQVSLSLFSTNNTQSDKIVLKNQLGTIRNQERIRIQFGKL